ncbi:HNH endonuclease [Adhaeribacter sp. BT258]|uniref:HNH endonuclease n=1 Tax=Adhaeribacter terrigena TaxID=2793070 RepID=A0ABS1C628_9BACT|nr:HNH endonuclease [Adhaeribacter terrigena]MBK0404647.1 HNH endonuclease [Adhaeribacter terrigena]
MTDSEILCQFENINTWKSKGIRAPHKPLLMLISLAEIQRGNTGFIPFSTIEPKLRDLLVDFGPSRKTVYPTFPFIRLANDNLWQFNEPSLINTKQDYSTTFLISNNLEGKFPDEIILRLIENPNLLKDVASFILNQNFPETIHQDILEAVGLDITIEPIQTLFKIRRRDPLFRDSILKAYEYQCAVCGFGVRLKNKVLALEAAHIMWHQAGGPDIEVNGLALCATHHKLFDLGAFTIGEKLNMLVSDEVNGLGANEWLINHHGKSLRAPQSKKYYPAPEFLQWHVKEVFKGGYRD